MTSLDEQYGDGYAEAAAEDRADQLDAQQLSDSYERYQGPLSWSEYVKAEAATAYAAEPVRDSDRVYSVEPDEDGNWF
jgi:hypothetical protein